MALSIHDKLLLLHVQLEDMELNIKAVELDHYQMTWTRVMGNVQRVHAALGAVRRVVRRKATIEQRRKG